MLPSKSSSSKKDQPVRRKDALKQMGKNLAKVMLPFATLHALTRPARAQFEELEAGRALNFILQIEFMQHAFYDQALQTNGLLDMEYRDIFSQIDNHQWKHILRIKTKLNALQVEPAPSLEFNFTAGGVLNPFEDFEIFLGMAQVFEDLSVGVYKSQIKIIHLNDPHNQILQMVTRAHTTESRHACFVRHLRTRLGFDSIKEWISNNQMGHLPDVFSNIYVKEDRLNQADIHLSSITDVESSALREAWDEPIGRDIARDIMQLFV